MPPQTRSKLNIHTLYPMDDVSISNSDLFEESSAVLHGKESDGWDSRYGTPIRPALPKRKCVSIAVQTSPVEEIFPHTPALCHGSSASSTPDPDSDGDGTYASKGGLKRKKSINSSQSPHASKKIKPISTVKQAAAPKQPRRESVASVEGNTSKTRSIYAPSPTPLQCTYIYPVALGPPRRPVDLRRAKGARIMPPEVAPPAAPGENGEAPTPMDVDAAHKITHRCPITFSREFEMRRHIRTVHIAEEIRAVVEGRLPRAEATVIPENWDGMTLLSKPTCSGCGTTFSRPDAVRRHQTEVNAKMENGICIECPGPKVHIRRGPRKDVFGEQTPAAAPAPAVAMVLQPIAPSAPIVTPIFAPAAAPVDTPAVMPAADAVTAPIPTTTTPEALAPVVSLPISAVSAPASIPAENAPATVPTVAPPSADTGLPIVAPTGTDPQPTQVTRERAEPAEGELESEDDM